jgi:predicted PurR-regulated permease PerM
VETAAERRRAVQVGLILLACAAGLAALWLAREVVLLGFLGVLIAVVFSFPVGWLSRVLPRGLAVLLVLIALVGATAGLIALAAPVLQREVDQLRESAPRAIERAQGSTRRGAAPARGLRKWVGGIVISMTLMGLFTAVGLAVVGIQEWLLLGVLTFLGTFVPYVGAIASSVPGLLAGLAQSPRHFVLAGAVYLGVHLVEGYLVQPIVMRRAVEVRPALLLFGQGVFGAVFGLLGTVVATPMLVCAQVLTEYLWVERRLGKEPGPTKRGSA